MRFLLTLAVKKNRFPIEYRRVILSYIKNALTSCNNGKFYDDFFGVEKLERETQISYIDKLRKIEKNSIN